MTDVKELVAEAIWNAESIRASGSARRVKWDDASEAAKDKYRPLARAALEALSRDRAGEQKVVAWRCFHCDEVFITKDAAQEHFGLDMLCAPGCCINLAEYRRMEEVHQQHLSETDEASKTFHAMRSDHHRALIKAEQDGYDKGLADGRALASVPPAAGER